MLTIKNLFIFTEKMPQSIDYAAFFLRRSIQGGLEFFGDYSEKIDVYGYEETADQADFDVF